MKGQRLDSTNFDLAKLETSYPAGIGNFPKQTVMMQAGAMMNKVMMNMAMRVDLLILHIPIQSTSTSQLSPMQQQQQQHPGHQLTLLLFTTAEGG